MPNIFCIISTGQYQDRSGYDSYLNPMPYDHYPRKYLAVMMEMGYNLSYSDVLPVSSLQRLGKFHTKATATDALEARCVGFSSNAVTVG